MRLYPRARKRCSRDGELSTRTAASYGCDLKRKEDWYVVYLIYGLR